MRKIIENLRNRPEEHRRHILHVLTLVFAFVLFVLWTFSLGSTVATTETADNLKADLAPFSVLKDNLVGGYESLNTGNEE